MVFNLVLKREGFKGKPIPSSLEIFRGVMVARKGYTVLAGSSSFSFIDISPAFFDPFQCLFSTTFIDNNRNFHPGTPVLS